MELTKEAMEKIVSEHREFEAMVTSLPSNEYLESVDIIAVYEAIYRMIHDNTIGCLYLSEVIMKHSGSLVSDLTYGFFKLDTPMYVEAYVKIRLEEIKNQ